MYTCFKKKHMVHNTCPFNLLAVMILIAYLKFSHYRNFVNSSCNVLLQFSKNLAIQGTSQNNYIERLNLLKTVFDDVSRITDITLIDARCNVLHMVTTFLNNALSVTDPIRCLNKKFMKKTNCSPRIA